MACDTKEVKLLDDTFWPETLSIYGTPLNLPALVLAQAFPNDPVLSAEASIVSGGKKKSIIKKKHLMLLYLMKSG